MDRFLRRTVTGLGAVALAACGHTDAFENPDRRTDAPFAPGEPLRLTYNGGPDQNPAFLASGDGVLFAFRRPGSEDGDQCLGVLPPGGGTARAEWCPLSAGARDSTDTWGEPFAVGADTLLYTRASRPIGAANPAWQWLGTAPLAAPDAYVPRVAFPFTATSGRLHLRPTFPIALGDGQVAYLAVEEVSATPAPDCDRCAETLVVGVEVALVELAGTAAPVPVPGTVRATSLAPGAAPGEFIYTLTGDSRVYRLRAGGTPEVLHTFAGIARDATLAGDRLLAVVGGDVELWYEGLPQTRTAQRDGGGPLVLVELTTGEETVVTAPDARYRRPRLAPDGSFAVIESAQSNVDLFRLALP